MRNPEHNCDRQGADLTRRQMLVASAGLAALACSRPRPAAQSRVSIVKAANYSADLEGTIRRLLTDHHLPIQGKRVLLKPNMVEFDAAIPITTHASLVYAVVESFRALGASEVRVAEGPANQSDALAIAEAAGYFEAIPRFEDLFIDLNHDDVTAIPLKHSRRGARSLYVARSAFAYDVVVSLPKMKTHHWAGVTLGMKNLFGFVPGSVYGWPKNLLHWSGIAESVADLHAALPVHFCIVDGIVGMEGNGPLQGTARPAGVLVAGRNLAAVDATCCRIMAVDPAKVRYLQLAGARYLDENAVEQIGETVRGVQVPFALIPEYQSIRLRQA